MDVQNKASHNKEVRVIEYLKSRGDMNVLLQLLEACKLDTIFDVSESNITLIAPTDEAFVRLFDDMEITKEEFMSNRELVDLLIKYHIIKKRLTLEEIANSTELISINDYEIKVDVMRDEQNGRMVVILQEFSEITELITCQDGVVCTVLEVMIPKLDIADTDIQPDTDELASDTSLKYSDDEDDN
ncbi:MAG: fasciclin domain-containing protein [Candidatus Dojkabacteria bacterium]|nr:fasciclin domain-containing protein [Candidatus Dojkabacteria bacterium]